MIFPFIFLTAIIISVFVIHGNIKVPDEEPIVQESEPITVDEIK